MKTMTNRLANEVFKNSGAEKTAQTMIQAGHGAK